jgi:hypothetical protein
MAVLLRLFGERLGEGEVAGWIEVVATGERRPVRDADELLGVLRSLAPGRPAGDGAPESP